MSNISQKLTYLNTTKTQLKGMINYGLDENNKITNETTFRDYVKSIFKAFLESLNNPDTLFTNLPKKSGTGANITLNDTANAPMKIMLSASEMSQSGTPTPDSPQDIHTISGDNTLMVEGKNLWNENAQVFTNQALLSNPTKDSNNVWTFTSSGSGYAFAISKKTLQAGTYTFSFSCVGGNAIVLNGSTTLNNTFTLNEETEITIRVFKSGAVEGDVIKLSNVMIEKGSTATPYEPYVSQEADINLGDIEYCKIGNYEDEFIRTSGKNWFDISKFKQGTWNNSTGNARVVGFLKKVKNGESYIVTLNNSNYNFAIGNSTSTNQDNNTAVQSDSGWQTSTYTYNITGDGYLWLQIRKSSGNISPSELLATDFMLNEGTTALPYEPYGSNEWYLEKKIGKRDLGLVEWIPVNNSASSRTQGLFTCFGFNGIVNYGYNVMPDILSNKYTPRTSYKYLTPGRNPDNYTCATYNGSIVYIQNSSFSDYTNEQVKEALNGTLLYYPLAIPTYTKITGTLAEQLENIYQKLKSFEGTTNISQVNNDLPFVLNVQALENLE